MSILTKLQDLRTEEEQNNNLYLTFDLSDSEAICNRISELAKIIKEYEEQALANWGTLYGNVAMEKGAYYAPYVPQDAKIMFPASISGAPKVVIYECA